MYATRFNYAFAGLDEETIADIAPTKGGEGAPVGERKAKLNLLLAELTLGDHAPRGIEPLQSWWLRRLRRFGVSGHFGHRVHARAVGKMSYDTSN